MITLNLKDWDGNRAMVAGAMNSLLQLSPNDPSLQIILNGLYSQQLRIDQLVKQLYLLQEENTRLSKYSSENIKRLILEVDTFSGRVGGE
jgi:hypothetical protein